MHHARQLLVVSAFCLLASLFPALQSSAQAAPPTRVDVCHTTGKSYKPMSINTNALPGHLGHGDVQQPNGAVPGTPGFVFDSNCDVVSWDSAANTTPDVSAIDSSSSGNLWAGTGIPATNFGTVRNESAGLELGLMVHYRQGPTVASADDYADGVLHVQVNDGPQSTANGSFQDSANHASWSYVWSLATFGGTDLNDYTFQLLFDVDPGPGTTYRVLQLEPDPTNNPPQDSGFGWRDLTTTLMAIVDDQGSSPNVTQNSHNYLFYQALLTAPYGPGTAYAGPAQFDIVLQALDGAQLVARNHIVVDVDEP